MIALVVRSVLLALLLTLLASLTMAARASSSREPSRWQPVRFSDLGELTPANVHGLLPLISRVSVGQFDDQGVPWQQPATAQNLQVDSLAAADLRLQHFLDKRFHLQLAAEGPARLRPPACAAGCEISYVTGTPAAVESAAAAAQGRGLRAWDPLAQRVVWSVTEAPPIPACTLVTAGGLVFYGTTDGWLKALDARTGRTLWKHRAEGRELNEPFSYRGADGHQYLAVHSLPRAADGGRETLLVFALAH